MRSGARNRSPAIAQGAIGVSLLLWTVAVSPARADRDSSRMEAGGSCRASESAEVTIDREHGGTIEITVAPGRMSYVQLPTWLPLRQARYIENRMQVTQVANGVEIIPTPGIPIDLVTTVRLRTDPGTPPVVVEVRVAADPEHYTRVANVTVEPRDLSCRRRVQSYIDETVERELDERLEAHTRKTVMAISAQFLTRDTYSPRAPVIDRNTPITAIPGPAAWIETETSKGPRTDFLWTFVIERASMGTVPVVGVIVRGPTGKERYPHVEFDAPVPTDAGDDVLATIPGQGRVTGIVQIPSADYQKDDVLTLEFFGPDRQRLGYTSANGFDETARVKMWIGEPITDEELQRRKEEKERIEEERRQRIRDREAKRPSLHVIGSYGAISFPAGAAGLDGTETTSLKGLGIRMTKGFFPALAFEAEIGGATSGVATFADVTVDGMTGDLTRSARLARASVGGVLRFGDQIVPNVRLGVGLQLVDQEATLMTGGGSVDMAGSGVEFAGAVYGGVGVDVELGSNLLLGAGLSFTQSDQRILDLGINLAWRWDAHE